MSKQTKFLRGDEMENCNKCKWVSLTEEEQQIKKDFHRCIKHKTILFHRSSDPYINHDFIYPCDKCQGKDFEQR